MNQIHVVEIFRQNENDDVGPAHTLTARLALPVSHGPSADLRARTGSYPRDGGRGLQTAFLGSPNALIC